MRFVWLLGLLLATVPAQADVTVAAPGGFTVKEVVHVTAAPARVWAMLIAPSRWWDSEHTWSGSAANLTFEARAGGCWCETLENGGSAQHMTVEFVDPPKTLRLRGALGPLGALAVVGVMGITLEAEGEGSIVTLSYQVGGAVPVDLSAIAPDVDQVLSAQTARLKEVAEAP
ncbi:MAG: SRPBCC family protein [Alphaproteobacteria bacterium]|nr:SRPBCC family protein [Alphaproteobacteria bacterium]